MTYTEDALVEQPAINLFKQLDWESATCWDEVFGESTPEHPLAFGRESRTDVILFARLKAALLKLNPDIAEPILQEAIDDVARDRSAMSPIAANEQVYLLLKNGYAYTTDAAGEEDCVVRYVDWNTPSQNDFLLCSQMTICGEIETRRPDLLGFVNGLPLVFVELKASHKNLLTAYKNNLSDYRKEIPQLFHYNQLIILSNGVQSQVGTISSKWEHFAEWKKIESEQEKRRVSLEVVIRGVCEKNRLLDIIENYTLFVKTKDTTKIVSKYHQYLGVNQALEGLNNVREREGQLGVFWHTQGSGKSYSMVFFCKKAFRKYTGNWTFVLITDRTDLDDQIYKTFHSTVRQINRIFKAILPDDSATHFVPTRIAINVIYAQMCQKSGITIDDEDVLEVVRTQVNDLLDEAISTIQIKSNLPEPINIAGIDFDALAEMVAAITAPKQSDAERLKNIIERKLQPMLLKNKVRQDLQQKFLELVEQYNLGAYTAEEFFNKLKDFIKDMSHEEQRNVREELTEEELAIFDLMTQAVPLSEKERNEVKRIAKALIERIQSILVIDWRKKQRTKARVRNVIEEILDELPDVYDDIAWPKTCSEVFFHIMEKYPGQGVQGVYS